MRIPIRAGDGKSRRELLRLRRASRRANRLAPLRMTGLKIAVGMLGLLWSGAAGATTYYVSSSMGSDGNNGISANTAWQTIGYVNAQTFQPGDTVLFKRGDTWNESLAPQSSGSLGNPISFDAYGTGAAPNFTGYYAVPSRNWTAVTGTAWRARLPDNFTTVNFCLFGSIWGQKVAASTANLTAQWDFYLANGYLYVYATSNPATYYNEPIVPMALSNVPVINTNGQSWLSFQHILVNWFDGYGVYVQGGSDHLVFANMEADSMIPQGTQPLGFYVNESAPGPGDVKIYNSEAHANYDGFRVDGAASAITMVNDKAYANRDGALVDNVGAVTYSYCHFYASSLAVAGSTDVEYGVTPPTAGAGNIPADTAPAVQVWQRYPARVTLTVDDAGMTQGTDLYYQNTVLPIADAAGVPVGAAITVGYPLAQTLVPEFQGWINEGRDVTSHSISHTYYTNTNALTVQYTGTGTAASLTIGGSPATLTMTVTGASDSMSCSLAQSWTPTSCGTIQELMNTLNATGKFRATLPPPPCQGPYGTGCSAYTAAALLAQDLASVSGQDVKTNPFTMQLNVTQLTTDEITLSREWMTQNLTGLPATPVYVYPGGYETPTMQGITAGVPYTGARGALKEDLGVKDTYGSGFDVENVTSFGVNPSWMGLTPASLQQKVQALVWKEQVWGVPWGIFWHYNATTQAGELSATEVTNLIADLQASGATILKNTDLVNWILGGTLSQGTGTTDGNFYYKSPALNAFSSNGALDFRPTAASPVVDAGQNLGAAYQIDINGVNQNSWGSGWEIGAHVYVPYSSYGTNPPGNSYFSVGGAGQAQTTAQLPQSWVNSNEWEGTTTNTINFPATGTGGTWSCGTTNYGPYTAGSQSSLQQAVNDAESCRTTNGSGTTIILSAGTLFSGASGLSLPQTAGDASSSFIVLTSSNPLPIGQTACSHGIQDNVSESTQPGIRNLGCNGQNLSYQLGTTVTPVSGSFTLADGTETSASAYNDIASMYTIECTGTNCDAVSTSTADANGVSPHHFAILNAQMLIQYGLGCCAPVKVGQGTETAVSQLPTHIHFAYDYVHEDWADAPVSGGVATGPAVGTTIIPADFTISGCVSCSILYSYVDQSLRPPSEGHVVSILLAQTLKFAHNWFEGMSSGVFCGGFASAITIPNFIGCQDIEDRANRYTYPYSWLLAKQAGFNPSQGSYVRKNAHEVKISQRYLFDGNIAENVDYSGAQGVTLSWKTDNTSGGALGTNYWIQQTNTTITNNIIRNGCNGVSVGSRSAISGGNGGGITLAAENYLYQNNLLYNMSAASNPGCAGSTPQYGFRIAGAAQQNVWQATVQRDGTGTIATLTLTSEAGGTQSDMNVGDPVTVTGCSDASFNTTVLPPTATTMPPLAMSGTSPTSLTVVYSNPGTANATATGCTFWNYQGWTANVVNNHNTDVIDSSSYANDPYSSAVGGSTPFALSRNLTFSNDMLIGGGINSVFAEGTRTETKAFDSTSLVFNNSFLGGRGGVSCPGFSGAACYTEYGGANAGASPPVTIYLTPANYCTGNDPTTENCAGVQGAMSASTFPLALSDWNQYRLCHAGDAACNGKASLYAAGGTYEASDGADLGFNPTATNAAEVSTEYVCGSACGAGPFSDLPVTDVYVSPMGSDSNAGTVAQPLLTIGKAQSVVRGLSRARSRPIRVALAGGTYNICGSLPCTQLSFNASDGGSATVPILWQAYAGQTAIIDGAYHLTGGSPAAACGGACTKYTWQPSGAIYSEQFWYNNTRRLRPRAGTGGLGSYYRLGAGTVTNAIPYTAGDPPDSSASWGNLHSTWNGSTCVAIGGNNYPDGDIQIGIFENAGMSKLPLWCVDSTNHVMYVLGNTSLATVSGNRYFVENIKPASDATATPGTWFLDRSTSPFTITYYANPGESPNTDGPGAEIPQLPASGSQVLLAQGLSWVTFSGLTVLHDNWTVGSGGYTYNRLDDAATVSGSTVSAAVSCQGCANVTMNGMTIAQTAGAGLEFFSCAVADKMCPSTNAAWVSESNTIENSFLYDLGAHGVRVGLLAHNGDTDANIAQGTTLENTVIQGVGRMLPKSFGVAMGCGHDNLFAHNDVNDSYGGGIAVGALNCPPGTTGSSGTFNNVVEYNHVWNLGQGLTNDLGGVYFNTSTPTFVPTGNQILYNRVHDVSDASSQDSSGFAGQGIYLDNFTGSVTVTGNLVYRTSAFPMNFTSGPDLASAANAISNNVFALGRSGMVNLNDPWTNVTCPGCTVLKANLANNIFYFDKTATNNPAFYFQRGCGYTGESSATGHGGDSYNLYMAFSGNTYFNAAENFGADAAAFHYQTTQAAAGGSAPYCGNSSSNWTFIGTAAWQSAPYSEDAGSSFNSNPGFVSPACVAAGGTDNWNFSAAPPSGFTTVPIASMGRVSGATVATIAATLPTQPFNCATDF